jgi:DNA-directed RNA polymerase specialized sigma24 family protein
VPPCEVFEWRRPETHDIFAEELPGMDAEGSTRERAVFVLVQAIDALSREGSSGMRAASALFWHYLRGKDVRRLAEESGVSEKTIKRLLAGGRARLSEILAEKMGIRELSDIL